MRRRKLKIGIVVGFIALVLGFSADFAASPTQFIAPDEPDPAVWGQFFPLHYESYLKTQEMEPTKHGGSMPFDKLEKNPRLLTIFAGNPFSIDYKEERGHFYSLTDAMMTRRLGNAKLGTCMTCKSAAVPRLIMEKGGPAEFYRTPFYDMAEQAKHPVACADCHDSQTMALRISRPALREALQQQGVDINRLTRDQMRLLVCAQCHVEYYFRGPDRYLVFPWAKGTKIEQIESFYDEIGFRDFVHAISGANLIKIQHPEYELFTADSPHFQLGLACADCHMPFQSDKRITSHWWTSPLKHMEQSCSRCHGRDTARLRARVEAIQDTTARLLEEAEVALVNAIQAIKSAADTPGVNEQALAEARALHRKAQIRWDFIAAENSTGFHNSREAQRVLTAAKEFALQAEATARRAAGG